MEQIEDLIVDGAEDGFATIKGTRIRVKDIVSLVKNDPELVSLSLNEQVAEGVLKDYYPHLSKGQVIAALVFWHNNSERIREEIERERKILEEGMDEG